MTIHVGGYHEYTGGCSVHRRDNKRALSRLRGCTAVGEVHPQTREKTYKSKDFPLLLFCTLSHQRNDHA